jgi:hypothetical protein
MRWWWAGVLLVLVLAGCGRGDLRGVRMSAYLPVYFNDDITVTAGFPPVDFSASSEEERLVLLRLFESFVPHDGESELPWHPYDRPILHGLGLRFTIHIVNEEHEVHMAFTAHHEGYGGYGYFVEVNIDDEPGAVPEDWFTFDYYAYVEARIMAEFVYFKVPFNRDFPGIYMSTRDTVILKIMGDEPRERMLVDSSDLLAVYKALNNDNMGNFVRNIETGIPELVIRPNVHDYPYWRDDVSLQLLLVNDDGEEVLFSFFRCRCCGTVIAVGQIEERPDEWYFAEPEGFSALTELLM